MFLFIFNDTNDKVNPEQNSTIHSNEGIESNTLKEYDRRLTTPQMDWRHENASKCIVAISLVAILSPSLEQHQLRHVKTG